jgi:hypothetical protein
VFERSGEVMNGFQIMNYAVRHYGELMKLPRGAEILSVVEEPNGHLRMDVFCYPNAPLEQRQIDVVPCGHIYDDTAVVHYVCTVTRRNGSVLHVFERIVK